MNLEQAFLLVAQALARSLPDDRLTEAARRVLVSAVLGHLPSSFPLAPHERHRVATWAQSQQEQHPDPVGTLYQQLLCLCIVRQAGGALAVQRERQTHRASGAYYTHAGIVRYMVAKARRFQPGARSVIDPACGHGAFLLESDRTFGKALTALVGLDCDPLAVDLARRRVPAARIHRADALLDQVPDGFDLCLGNPPYISSGLRGSVRHPDDWVRLLRHRYRHTAQYKVNTYPLFVERGLELLRPGGVLGYILPDSFLSGRFFAGLRQLLLSHTLLEITLVRDDFWEHGRVGQSVILFVRKGQAPSSHQVEVRVCEGESDLSSYPATRIPQSELAWGPFDRFLIAVEPAVRSLVQQVNGLREASPLGKYLRSYSGLIARNGQASILRSRNPGLAGPWGRLLRSGKEIDRYRIAWAGEYVCLDRRLIKSGGHLSYYQNPKLLLRQTADSLRAAYDDSGFYCLNNIHLLIPRAASTPLRALLAILNGTLVNRYYQALTLETGRLYPQVDLDILTCIPVPPLAPEMAEQLTHLAYARENAASEEAAALEQEIDRLVHRLYRVPD